MRERWSMPRSWHHLRAWCHLHGISKRAASAHIGATSAATSDRCPCKPHDANRREAMFKKSAWAGVILTLIAVPTFAAFSAAPAEAAVVYCKTAGVPQGCVVRPV